MPTAGMLPMVASASQERLMGQHQQMYSGNKGFARTAPAASMGEEVERGYQREIRDLKKQLAASKRDNGKLRASQVSQQTNKATLEEFFLRSIESVKRDIGRRRKKAAMQRGGMSGTNLGGTNSMSDLAMTGGDDKNTANALDQFTSTDRARVIERLLAQDEVLAFLYDHLFPAQPTQGPGMAIEQGPPSPQSMQRQAGPSAGPQVDFAAGSGAAAALGKKGPRTLPLSSDTLDFLQNKRPESSLL